MFLRQMLAGKRIFGVSVIMGGHGSAVMSVTCSFSPGSLLTGLFICLVAASNLGLWGGRMSGGRLSSLGSVLVWLRGVGCSSSVRPAWARPVWRGRVLMRRGARVPPPRGSPAAGGGGGGALCGRG